jgi:hypothetical protein
LISDGILYFIGLAAAALDSIQCRGAHGLIFIEEPENGIHSPALHEIVFGLDEEPDESLRTTAALDLIGREGALTRLRERPSFNRFERQVTRWIAPVAP